MNTVRLGWTLVYFLWQGTLIAALYATLRSLAARTQSRYLLACGALAAMMISPVATWIALASQGDGAQAAAVNLTARVPHTIAQPLALPAVAEGATADLQARPWIEWAVAIWMAGASALSVRLLGGWILAVRLRSQMTRPAPAEWTMAVDRLRARWRIGKAVTVRISALVQSPVVVGAWRPLILAPVGMLTGLPAAQVEALLAHELAHIERHDYLVNILQSVVEALLFYHPAVWWVSGHIRAERECCCDDAAVAQGAETFEYVNALAALAGSRPMQVPAVAANGGSVRDRIARLLGEPRPSAARGSLLGVVVLAAASFGLFAQETERPSFQAASIKLNTENPPNRMVRPMPGGRLTTRNANLAMLILTAYGMQHYQLIGGPPWLETEGFDIEAKAEGEASMAQTLLMLQSLLADRFKLAMHRDTREQPVYVLTGAKGAFHPSAIKEGGCVSMQPGSPLPPNAVPCGMVRTGFSGSLDGEQVAMPNVVKMLASVMGRPVIDQTVFSGAIDVHLKFTPDGSTQGLPGGALGAAPADPEPSRPNIFEALKEQLGLKLTPAKGPVEVLVIEHVEKPTAN